MNLIRAIFTDDRFKREGSIRGLLATIPGALLFGVIDVLVWRMWIGHRNPISQDDVSFFFMVAFVMGLVLSFFPAVLGGWVLAFWLQREHQPLTERSGIRKGSLTAGSFMAAFDSLLALLIWGLNHGPSPEMFVFYMVTSVAIAVEMGGWIGLQLTRSLLRQNLSNE